MDHAESVSQRRRYHTRPCSSADKGKVRKIEPHGPGRRSLAYHEIELIILHRRIEDLFHTLIEPVDLIYEQYFILFEIGKYGSQVSRLLDGRTGSNVKTYAHLIGDDTCKSSLTESRRPIEQYMIERFTALLGCFDEYLEIGLDLCLSGIIFKPYRS